MFSTASVTRTFRRKFSSLTFINNTGLYFWSWLVLCTKSFVYVTIYLSKSKSARFVVEVVTKPPIKKMHQTRRQTQNMLSCRLAAQKACYMIGKILTHITKPIQVVMKDQSFLAFATFAFSKRFQKCFSEKK